MSASRKFDLSSDSPDRPLYGSGHHGSYGAASLDRSGSFRENMETPLLSSLPNMTRSCSAVTQGDVHSFFQCVRFDPKSMVAEHKLNRPPEFKRLASAAVSIPTPDSLHASSKRKNLPSSSVEDLRRLKSGVRESGTKARERVKILNDCLSVINKFFPAIPSRKRSSSILQAERTTAGMGLSKMGTQNHVNSSGVEPERCEERTKNPIPNKRPRTSILDSKIDSRVRSPGRPSGTLIRRVVGRLPNTGVVQGEDHTLSIGVNGWDKSKMRKRRTGTKLDTPASSVATKPTDGYRESKERMQPRVPIDSRSRLPDSHFSRSVIVNGSVSAAKPEVSAQATSGMHSAICSTDSDNSSPLYERRDHPGGQEKGRAKVPNKENSREGFSSGSPTAVKLSANVRAPRSGSYGVSKLSQVVPRSPSSNNWELNNCTSKSPGALAATTNRRRTPVRSPSPPVTNWVQKPQKISRTPRRTNLSPIMPGFDENPVLATASKLMVTPPDSPQLFKLKSDYLSPGALSESEELHDAEVMFREKSIMCDDVDVKSGNVQKLSALMIPPKNIKAVSRATHGDGVKRQGRTGRGYSSSRSGSPLTVQKHGVLGTTKQIRSARPGLEKSERIGRPPTRKLSDRKPYTRHKQTATTMIADLSVGSNDGHEELLTAAHAVTNTAQALSSPLWKDVEPVFRFISDKDISYLKHQIDLDSSVDTLGPAHPDTDSSSLVPHGRKMNDYGREESETLSVELGPEDIPPSAKTDFEISLCQRLMAALIPEDGNLELLSSGKEDNYDMYDSGFKVEKDMEADTFCFEVSQICSMSGYPSNGYSVNSNGKSCYELGRPKQDTNIVSISDTAVTLHYEGLENGTLEDHVNPVTASSDYQYGNMSLNERLLVELKSIGIYPNLESADELNEIISGFEEKLQEKVSMKKISLGKLLSPSDEAKKFQEMEFEGRALDKLCEMANEKYMSSWGPYAQGMKSSTGKMAKQAALSLVKRTVHRCREFEAVGKSCFGETLYKDVFLSGVLRLGDTQSLNSNSDNEFGKLCRSTSRCSMEIRTSDNQQSPSNNHSSGNLGSGRNTHKEDTWSDRVKKRELLLDDIGGMMNGSLSCNAKGKKSESDREVKGNIEEFSSTKIGRSTSAAIKRERKYKTKPKKTSLLSTTISVPVGKMLEQPKVTVSPKFKSHDNICGSDIDEHKNDSTMEILEDPIDLSGLQLPGMEDFGGPDDLGGQGGDIDSWLNIEDDELHDHDFMGGLGIPMDDLSGLDMLV